MTGFGKIYLNRNIYNKTKNMECYNIIVYIPILLADIYLGIGSKTSAYLKAN